MPEWVPAGVAASRPSSASDLPELTTIDDVARFVEDRPGDVYVRFAGPDPDSVGTPSLDHETGITLPGAAANPLDPPKWWGPRPLAEWVARRIRTYSHLQHMDRRRVCWICTGTVVDRGPDNEPLLADVSVLAAVARAVVEASEGRAPTMSRPEDETAENAPTPWQSG